MLHGGGRVQPDFPSVLAYFSVNALFWRLQGTDGEKAVMGEEEGAVGQFRMDELFQITLFMDLVKVFGFWFQKVQSDSSEVDLLLSL